MDLYNELQTLAPQQQACLNGIGGYSSNMQGYSSSGQGYSSYLPEQHLHYHNSLCLCGCCQSGRPLMAHDTQIVIEWVGKEIKLDYGGRLRLLMADPVKGQDLRDALAKVQAALAVALQAAF